MDKKMFNLKYYKLSLKLFTSSTSMSFTHIDNLTKSEIS
jgi:hypothetical protein